MTGVLPLAVVETEIPVDSGPRVGHGLVGPQIHLFVVQAAPRPLGENVVDLATLAVHTDADTAPLAHRSERVAGELAALVGVEDLRLSVARQRVPQGRV